jgi:DNA-directed RNA polymerase subunit L
MSGQAGIDSSKARIISDACSDFKLPDVSAHELATMDHAAWMAKFGDTLSSERYFESRDPNWQQNPNSWWFKSVERSTADGQQQQPLWMRQEYRMPELDCPQGADRHSAPLDSRPDKPKWAERMGRTGSKLGPQSSTIYGYRREYKPTEKTSARSMYERYQPKFERAVNEELPDMSDPADGRFWLAGVAQGVTSNPYEKRLTTSARRKPIVIGPRSLSVVVDGEGHTLANVVRDTAWLHPNVEFAGYSCEHPVYRHINMRIQTKKVAGNDADGGDIIPVTGERAMVETLELTKKLFTAVGEAMEADVEAYEDRKVAMTVEKDKKEKMDAAQKKEREKKMKKWAKMMSGEVKWEAEIEIELFGKVISPEMQK